MLGTRLEPQVADGEEAVAPVVENLNISPAHLIGILQRLGNNSQRFDFDQMGIQRMHFQNMGMVKGWKFCREYWFLRKGWVKISGFGFENRQGGDENERGKVRERREVGE